MLQTPLDATHRALGARMIPFAGWEMPVQYTGLVEEHVAVRNAAGLFDLSHMGELHVKGSGAAAALDFALVTAPSRLAVGRAHYSMICDDSGAVLDDLIVYRLADAHFLVVANASNRETVAAAIAERLAGFDATIDDASLLTALVAIQGPRSAAMLQAHTDVDLTPLKYYAIMTATVAGVPVMIARTGYTGEDGFEIFVAWDEARTVWDTLLAAGRPDGLIPCGLGSRDTLRLEAGMPLYGQELDRTTTPFEAGLGRVVKFDKPGDFVGRKALEAAKDAPTKQLVALKVTGRGIARTGYPVYLPAAESAVGSVTSGTTSPTLGVAIAMAWLPPAHAALGTVVEVGIRSQRASAEVMALPFYKRST
ncbi:MAG: glycine cleavage system aminomethyltransferase GcvT [Gemmatimonadales bacterium]|nr:glycine cleavage system aminomethyltransferase GcvT [Gemmatimonadales bacterium]MDZ4391271.1 glycine cleavage system aminomethyltransferase GcvT [Gemmatimonadales bacterium]